MLRTFICLAVLMQAGIALGDVSTVDVSSLPWVTKIVPIVLFAQLVLRLLAEVLKNLAALTANAKEGTAADYLATAANTIGTVLGFFGLGTPSNPVKAAAVAAQAPASDNVSK